MLWLCIRLPQIARDSLTGSAGEAVETLAAWGYQYTSQVSYRLADGSTPAGVESPTASHGHSLLWLELGASSTLFGTPTQQLANIEQQLTELRYSHACALAPSPAAAALLTQLGADPAQRCVLTLQELRARLAPLPLAWLELPAATLEALHACGLRRIGELLALPATALTRRFGPDACLYLHRLER